MPRSLENHKKYRFTLIELLTVIAVIGVLMGMSIGVFSYVSTRMAEARTRATIAKIESALESYKSKYGVYPVFPMIAAQKVIFANARITAFYLDDNFTAFNSLVDYEGLKANDSAVNTGTTTPRWLIDAFGGAIIYRCPGYFNRNSYDLGSMGSDSKFGDGSAAVDCGSATTPTSPATSINNYWGKGDDITNFTRK